MYKDLTPKQAELARYMSDLSEQAWRAGWMSGLEFALWDVLLGNRNKFGCLTFELAHIERLRALSQACAGWITYDDGKGELWVPVEEWRTRFDAWIESPESRRGNTPWLNDV
jgi:hypothetical protein